MAASSLVECTNSSFIPITELAKTLPAQAASVAIRILLSSGQWEDCSGAVVSDEGDIVTASHCLDHCVAEKRTI